MPDINLLEGREFTASEELSLSAEEVLSQEAAVESQIAVPDSLMAEIAEEPAPEPLEPSPEKIKDPSQSSYDRPSAWPIVAIIVVVLSWNLLGDALRDVLDPRLRGVRAPA